MAALDHRALTWAMLFDPGGVDYVMDCPGTWAVQEVSGGLYRMFLVHFMWVCIFAFLHGHNDVEVVVLVISVTSPLCNRDSFFSLHSCIEMSTDHLTLITVDTSTMPMRSGDQQQNTVSVKCARW